jgi:hypothetical protein
MQRRRFSFPGCCCALLCCVVVLFSTRSPPHAVLLVTDLSLPVVVRVLGGGLGQRGCVGVGCCAVVVPWFFDLLLRGAGARGGAGNTDIPGGGGVLLAAFPY